MHTSANIAPQSSYQSVAGSLTREATDTRGAYLQDNRSSSVAQRKRVKDMGNLKTVKSTKNNPDLPFQLKTEINNVGQQYNYNGESVTVGKTTEAWLDPNDLVQGQEAGINKSQNDLMDAIRGKYKIDGGDVVKGHLLNDNLGGKALGKNLYPITRAANKDHLTHVENFAKKFVWAEDMPIYYSVEVVGKPDLSESKASFVTGIFEWDGKTPGAKGIGKGIEKTRVESDFGNTRLYGQAFDPDKPGVEAGRESNQKKPKTFKAPYNRVGDLPEDQLKERNEDK